MENTLNEYEKKLETVRRRRAQVTAELNALTREDQELDTVERGWMAIIAMERRLSGEMEPTSVINAADLASVSTLQEPEQQAKDEEEGENKTQFVRSQIRARAAIGTTPKDLKTAAVAAKMTYPPSWPYGPLQRLKKKGEIVKRKGRFFPKESTN